MSLGPAEVLLILGVALLLFGPSRIAGVGKGLGEGIRGFRDGLRAVEAPPQQVEPGDGDKGVANP